MRREKSLAEDTHTRAVGVSYTPGPFFMYNIDTGHRQRGTAAFYNMHPKREKKSRERESVPGGWMAINIFSVTPLFSIRARCARSRIFVGSVYSRVA